MPTPHAQTPSGQVPPASAQSEAERLDALARYSIVDTSPETIYDATVAMAAALAEAPIATLTFVDRDREWVKSAYGADLHAVLRGGSLGAAVVAGGRPLVIEDAAAEELFADHPWVAGAPRARFCTAVPIRTRGGIPLGTLTVLDTRPRRDGAAVIDRLEPAVRVFAEMLEHRRERCMAGALTAAMDYEGRFVRLGAAWEQILGFPPEKAIGRCLLDFIHPEDHERTVAALENFGDGFDGFTNRYVSADGTVRWLRWTGTAVPEERLGYGVAQDVTEAMESGLKLRESEERYRVLAESATDMIARHGFDGRLEYVSHGVAELLGYSPDELADVDPYEFIHPDDRATVRTFHQALLNGTEHVRVVFRERHKAGHYVWVESVLNLLRDGNGQPIGIQTVTRDISEAKRATDALQEAEERFRKAFEDAPIGMAIVGAQAEFVRVNRALATLLDYSEAELLSRGMADITHPDDFRPTEEFQELLERTARAVTLEKRLVRRDGSEVWVSVSASLTRGADGTPLGVLAQFLDVSERHRAEAEARRAREAAERANRAKSAFLARMSHELRTPLNAILGFAQLLELDDLTAEQRDSAARIVRGGSHLVELIDDVLDISRIEAGELSVDLGPVPVGEVIDEVASLLRPLASSRSIALVTTADSQVHASADRQRLKQVVLNLVSNAIKYGPTGSKVEIVARAGDRVRIAVVDEGPGLSDDESERVFRPFERLPAHAYVEGTGLGLALSRNLVRALGGDIGVRAAGPGSEFWVELDGAAPAPVAPPLERPQMPVAADDGEQRTLLYVEDSPANVDFTRRLLERRPNVELLVARDVASGRRLAHTCRPDAILLDIDLPDGDGGDLLGELKADPETADIPVVVLTADARRAQQERVLEAGACAYAAKPVDVRELLRTLDAALTG